MQISFVFFILLAIISILGSLYLKFNSNEGLAGIVLAVGILIISVFFGKRWFTPSGDYTTSPSGKWPPTMNVCPDYLSLTTINGVKVCIDPVGVSLKDKTSPFKKWTGPSNTGDDYVFNLMLEKTGEARAKDLCKQCELKGLTWEGLFDGNACTDVEPPRL